MNVLSLRGERAACKAKSSPDQKFKLDRKRQVQFAFSELSFQAPLKKTAL